MDTFSVLKILLVLSFPPASLYAIVAAFGARTPLAFVTRALAKGIIQEARWLRERVAPR